MLESKEFVRTILVSGEAEHCKAFLFEATILWAKEGQNVYYFASKHLESLPLIFHDGSEPSADALKLITFIYASTYDDLVNQLLKLHTFQKPASIILVDDLDVFTNHPNIQNNPREIHVSRCCAVLLNAAQFCSNVLSKPVHLCAASFTRGKHEAIYRKYFDNHWTVISETENDNSADSRKVWLKKANNGKTFEFCRLDDAVLMLNRILDLDVDFSL